MCMIILHISQNCIITIVSLTSVSFTRLLLYVQDIRHLQWYKIKTWHHDFISSVKDLMLGLRRVSCNIFMMNKSYFGWCLSCRQMSSITGLRRCWVCLTLVGVYLVGRGLRRCWVCLTLVGVCLVGRGFKEMLSLSYFDWCLSCRQMSSITGLRRCWEFVDRLIPSWTSPTSWMPSTPNPQS
jgi:hypothetical protein